MRIAPLALGLFIAASAAAQTPREIFPSDYTPSPCASTDPCDSFERGKLKAASASFQGVDLNDAWLEKHLDELKADLAPLCRKHGTCFAHPSNSFTFCDDVMYSEARPICERRFPTATAKFDHEQCRLTMEIYLLGVEQHAKPFWQEAQRCTRALPAVAHPKPLDIWMVPETITAGYKDYVTFYALDPETHVPVFADISFEGQQHYAPANPVGRSAAYYPFKLPFKFIRVPNAAGHTDLLPPNVTVQAGGYPASTFRLSAAVPRAIVEMTPPASALRPGKNTVTVKARDAGTGKPVELRVMLGETAVGSSNAPITLVLPKGKRPEIWVTSLFDRYSDMVIK